MNTIIGGSTIEMDIGIGGTVTVADNKPKLTILEQPKSVSQGRTSINGPIYILHT